MNEPLGYFSTLRIPEGKKGDWEIKHVTEPKGKKMDVLNMRDALFGFGGKPKYMILDKPHRVHELLQNGGRWMSDCPSEIYTQQMLFKDFTGDVLVGGLGLGFAAVDMAAQKEISSVTCVEIEKDVIDLVWPHVKTKKIKLVHGDLFEYLKECQRQGRKFDYAFYDIWCPTGETVLQTHVWPLRELSYGIIDQENIECWGEPTMLGQVRMAIDTTLALWNEGQMFPNGMSMKDIPEEQFIKARQGLGMQWAFVNYMRQAKPKAAYARWKAQGYVAALRDPKAWKAEWERWAEPVKPASK